MTGGCPGNGQQIMRRAGPLAALIMPVLLLVLAACETDPAPEPTPFPTPPPINDDLPPPGDEQLNAIPRTTDARVSITGAGATFPNVLYSVWVDEYNQLNRGVRINYQSVGSGAGIRSIIDRTVDFGATDGPMDDEQKAEAPGRIIHIPAAMGAVVPSYHLRDAPDSLRFSQETIAGIFLGQVTRWDDPRIAADNPGVDFPDRDIAVCHRSDGAGTTFIWADFMAAISDEWAETIGVGTSLRWPRGAFLGGNGNEGVAACISQINGAIGYVEIAYAIQNDLNVALLENFDGNFVEPSLEAVTAAATGLIKAGEFPADMEARIVNAPGPDAWPAAGFTWMLVYEELDLLGGMTLTRAQELVRYLLWTLDRDGGQRYTIPLDYAPLDRAVIELAHDAIKTITFDGQPVWETMLNEQSPATSQ